MFAIKCACLVFASALSVALAWVYIAPPVAGALLALLALAALLRGVSSLVDAGIAELEQYAKGFPLQQSRFQ